MANRPKGNRRQNGNGKIRTNDRLKKGARIKMSPWVSPAAYDIIRREARKCRVSISYFMVSAQNEAIGLTEEE